MMEWRPNPIRSAGADHARYRAANLFALSGVDLHAMHSTVEQIAIPLINTFCEDGYADLVSQYAFPPAFAVINAILGCPADLGRQAATGMAAIFEGINATKGNAMLADAALELTQRKRANPGDDVTSRLLQHPNELTDEEMIHQLITIYGAGIEPVQNLIVNTLLLMMTDDRFASNIPDGSLATRDALEEVLFTDPPLANYCIGYPRQPVFVDGVWLPAHQPVVVSMSACNNDPAIRSGDFTDNRSHLAWGVGPHAGHLPESASTEYVVGNQKSRSRSTPCGSSRRSARCCSSRPSRSRASRSITSPPVRAGVRPRGLARPEISMAAVMAHR